jgi:hypothetical protein
MSKPQLFCTKPVMTAEVSLIDGLRGTVQDQAAGRRDRTRVVG